MKFNQESKTTSFLSDACELKGNLFSKGGIRIDGKIQGTLNCESTVFIGETAEVEADVTTKSLIAGGSITGSITAEDTVQINRPGSIRGEILTGNLRIEKDVYFNGRCRLLNPKDNNNRTVLMKPKSPRKAIPEFD